MSLQLPRNLVPVLRPLFKALPLSRAMTALVIGPGNAPPADSTHVDQVAALVQRKALAEKPELQAGLWLYVDQLDRAHAVSQAMDSPTGAFWHAIVHRREGDFSNSKYWYRRVGHHPSMAHIDISGGSAGSGTSVGGYEPIAFVDRVERCWKEQDGRCPELVALQHREWASLFEWCAEHR